MENNELVKNNKRLDGREMNEMRPFKIEAGILKNAHGSALLEWGGNKIIAGVYGPKECIPRHEANPFKAKLNCKYMMSPFCSKEEHGRAGPNRRSIELSMVLREALENVVELERYPKAMIEVSIEVLEAEGGTRCAALVAGAVALANAGIPMRDLPVAVAAGKIADQICLDCSKIEDNSGQADFPVALAPRNNDILLMQMDGLMTKEEMFKALDFIEQSAEEIKKVEREALEKAINKLD
jgi:exosome complex component RRP41